VIVLADLDGTLVDSAASNERAWRAWGARHGIPFAAIAAIYAGRPSADVVAELAPGLDARREAELLDDAQARDAHDVVALPGAVDLLRGAAGGPVAIVTSCTPPLASARIAAAGLPAPRALVTSDRVARGKPDPAGFLLAARELGADPRACVVLEDAPAGVAAARAAGAHVVGITADPAALPGAHEHAPSVAAWLARRDG
jgi:sugar-phosphatase